MRRLSSQGSDTDRRDERSDTLRKRQNTVGEGGGDDDILLYGLLHALRFLSNRLARLCATSSKFTSGFKNRVGMMMMMEIAIP